MRKIRSNCYLSVFLRFELSFFLSIFFHILSWFLCIFSETEEYIAHQLFHSRKKTFSHNSLLLETHNILTFSDWQKKNISNYKGLGIGRLLLLITKYSLFSKQFIWRASKAEYFTGTQNPLVWTMRRLHRSYFSPTKEQTTSVLGCGYHVHISHQLVSLWMTF